MPPFDLKTHVQFSILVGYEWKKQLSRLMGGRASPRGGPKLTWLNKKSFKIRQSVTVKINNWPNYKAWFEYTVGVTHPYGTGANHDQRTWVTRGVFRSLIKRKFDQQA